MKMRPLIVIAAVFGAIVCQAQNGVNILTLQANFSAGFLIANIAPNLANAAPGVIVASSSRGYPNDFFYRVQDGAIAMDYINRLYVAKKVPVYMQNLLSYASLTRANQKSKVTFVSHLNPLSNLDFSGIAVPKFNANGTPINPPAPAPENDGPALRATTLIHTALILIGQGRFTPVIHEKLYDGRTPTQSVIKADLDYIARHWNDPSYDLWDEVKGHHFYTLMVERRAMIEGAKLAQLLQDGVSVRKYTEVATAISAVIPSFWDPARRILIATQSGFASAISKPSGLDVGTLLGVLLGSMGDGFYGPSNDQVLATAFALQQAFIKVYPKNRTIRTGTAIGRYPEDLFNGVTYAGGANPWFLATLAYAELCYRAAGEFQAAGVIRITPWNKPFLDEAIGDNTLLTVGQVIHGSNSAFPAVIKGLAVMGDSFMKTVLAHRGPDGSLSEQFQIAGFQAGALNLTWSHVAFENAYDAWYILHHTAFRGN